MNSNNTETKRNRSCEIEVLTFTCPHCGGDKLEELVMMERRIEWVAAPSAPNYDWDCDPDSNISRGLTSLSSESDRNRYRCKQCGAPLTDRDGNIFWGSKLLYEWLRQNRDQGAKERPQRKMRRFTCPKCGGHNLEDVVTGQWSKCKVIGVFEDGEIVPGFNRIDGNGDRWFQCGDCRYQLENENGLISDDDELVEWLFGRCPEHEDEDADTSHHESKE
jgi:Zn finger protein HypA/HybF involved in hydrogenase expression